MIVRRRALSKDKDSMSMNITYVHYNVLAMLREMFQAHGDFYDDENQVFNIKFAAKDFINYFEKTHFRYYNKNFRRVLSKWALSVAERKGYVEIDEDEHRKVYYLAETCKRPNGRPRKKDDIWGEFGGNEVDEDDNDI